MKRSKFSLSNYKLLTCDMGELVPVGLYEVLPGDTVQQATSLLLRVSPLLAPVMHPVHVRIHHWFVPFRLIWEDWENFITGGPDGLNASVVPYRDSNAVWSDGGQADYFGIKPGTGYPNICVLPFRAYDLIFNEWYRDQDLMTPVVMSKASGADNSTDVSLQNVCWEKDYFTTSRLTPQKGAQVTLPLGTTAPIIRANNAGASWAYNAGTNTIAGAGAVTSPGSSSALQVNNVDVSISPGPGALLADLSSATAASIDALRRAYAIQRYEEARMRYGSRYTEYLAYLGVRSSDARLQRPEYLGGGKQTIQFSEVLQTGVTTSGNEAGVGNLRGHGIAAMRSNRYRRFFEEHGYVVSLLSIVPKTMYGDGLHRLWSRTTKEDFYQKELEHIGMQEVLNKEIKVDHATPAGVLGYQDRYDEYRRMESSIAGDFRSTLNFYHYARQFATDPALNDDLVRAVPTKRVNVTQNADVLWVMANHSIQARRILAQVGTPGGLR